jgi:hypothetical protein
MGKDYRDLLFADWLFTIRELHAALSATPGSKDKCLQL